MNNKVLIKCSGSAADTNFTTLAKLAIFSEEINTFTNGAAFDQVLEFNLRFVPSGITITNAVVGGEIAAYTPNFSTVRQDVKTVDVEELPKAMEGQGVVVLESTFNEYKKYFTNSFVVPVDDKFLRVGVSNFTQTEDNNPYSAVTSILYFQL